jgi:pyochelin biosynthesis protein PchD
MRGIQNPIEGVIYPDPERTSTWHSNGSWIDSTVGDALRAIAKSHPEREAYISDERTVRFGELDETTDRLAAGLLESGMAPGDRAIFQLGTTVDTAIVLLACYKAGIVPVCSLPQHREIEIGQLTEQSGARGYFVQADFGSFDLPAFAADMLARHATLEHLFIVRGTAARGNSIDSLIEGMPLERARKRLQDVPVGTEDVLSFQLSGGTTGLPKIIPRFHAEYLGQSAAWMRLCKLDMNSCVIWSLPLIHNAGQLYALIPVVLRGSATVLMPRVDIERMLELIEKHRVTHAVSIGPIAPQLLAYRDLGRHDLSSLKMFATLSRSETLEAHLKLPCSNQFGITEGLLLGMPPDAPAYARHHTQGTSGCPHDELRLLVPETERPVKDGEMGELCFRGPSSLTGFFNAPEANAKAFTSDGFYRTGDMMTAHVIEGVRYLAFEGRLRDNVNRGGEKIGCEEVESLVSQHPSVADAKLVAMPDPVYGEKACVYIILRPEKTAPDVKVLGAFLAGLGLARYKCPERIEIIDSFPLTRVGKVDKAVLKKLIAEKLTIEAGAVKP